MSRAIVYVTDLEGRWEKLEQALAGCTLTEVRGSDILVAPDTTFVYGGDCVDRGPASLRLVRTLVAAARRQPGQVVLLAGNRDINKLRLPRELGAHPPSRGGETAPAPLPDRLRWILARTMGAGHAFSHRSAEIHGDDDAVVASFLAEVAVEPEGSLLAYLREARLAWRWRDVLFVHGAVTEENLGVVPGERDAADVDAWIAGLDRFIRGQVAAYAADPQGTGHHALVAYQAPEPGTRANPGSVVYGRPVDPAGDPELPSPALRERLAKDGIRRVVVGHTPTGDFPSIVHEDGFTLFLGDTSYSPLEHGARIELTGDAARIVGRALVDGRAVDLRVDVGPDVPPPLGRKVDGWLVNAPLGDGWMVFRMGEGFAAKQEWRRG